METIRFTVPEILALLGMAQCVYVLVYMLFRSGRLSRGTLPAIYFAVLGAAFLTDAAYRFWSPMVDSYPYWQWLFWFSGPPLSVLLIRQIAEITKMPPLRSYWVLVLIPAAFVSAYVLSQAGGVCETRVPCAEFEQWLVVCGVIAAGVSLLAIWARRDLLEGLHGLKNGRERFWLIMALIFLNAMFMADMLASVLDVISPEDVRVYRAGLGIAFGYIASTSLLRLYPQAMRVETEDLSELSDEEIEIALKIERLMHVEKVYQEPSFGRKELSQEVGVSEAALSRVINVYFEKSVPHLLNEARVEDACALLLQTEVAVKTIAEESGFNSLASFNRVFKDMTGLSPSEYRRKRAA
jgi:AraC-like DNA-binding protein